jgi:ATP-dependent DNA helicase RecQ
VQRGYLIQEGEFRTLRLTPKALQALKKRTPIMGQLQEVEERPGNAKARKTELEYNHALYALLRRKRKELADESGIPPYVIFSDKTLVEMCAYYPQSLESLLNISGVGQVKLNQFGEGFLAVIKAYCLKKNLKEKKKDVPPPKNGPKARHIRIGEAYNSGESVQNLMEQYQVKLGTILSHLEKFVAEGNTLRNSADFSMLSTISPHDRQIVSQVFDELGTVYLRPVFDKLGGTINYDELRILRLIYLTNPDA